MPELQERIVAHHVGARGFGVAFNCPPRFAKDLIHVVYEADEQCANEMIAENKDDNFHVLPYCLGQDNERAKLYICENPYFSSNLQPNSTYAKYYCEVHFYGLVDGVNLNGECYDVDYAGDMRVARVADVAVRALDDVLQDPKMPAGRSPDFLSLDTQGSELRILKGGERTFRDHCLALSTEIEFHQLYQNQPLFADLAEFAHRHGFHFAGFTYLQEFSSYRLPIGARDKGFIGFGDALFLRSIESVRAMAKPPEERYVALLKLAFIALNFGYLEYAMQAADAAEETTPSPDLRARLGERDCYKIVQALRAAIGELPQEFPYSVRTEMTDAVRRRGEVREEKRKGVQAQRAEAIARARAERDALQRQIERHIEAGRLRNLARTDPAAAAGKAFRYLLQATLKVRYADPREAELRATMARLDADLAALASGTVELAPEPARSSPTTTPVERVLEEFGYTWLADSVRRRRKSAEGSVAGKMC